MSGGACVFLVSGCRVAAVASERRAFVFSTSLTSALRLINHPARAPLLCFRFKCRIDGFFLRFIDLCIMVLSLGLLSGEQQQLALCVSYCSAPRN